MSRITHKFKLLLPDYPDGVLYAELDTTDTNKRYAKTFFDGKQLQVVYINIQEYASALAHITLRLTGLTY